MKRLNFRKWLSLEDAASAVSERLGEKIDAPDLLRASIDGQLRLSVHFVNGAYAEFYDPIPPASANAMLTPIARDQNPLSFDYPDDAPCMGTLEELEAWLASKDGAAYRAVLVPVVLDPTDETGEQFLRGRALVEHIDGVWDLARVGGAPLDLEHLYQRLTGGPRVSATLLDAVWVISQDGESHAMLRRRKDKRTLDFPPSRDLAAYPPLFALDDSKTPLVVRTDELKRWVSELLAEPVDVPAEPWSGDSGGEPEKPQWKRELNSALKVISALDRMAKLPPKAPETVIRREMELLGLDKPPSEQTIRKFISQARGKKAN